MLATFWGQKIYEEDGVCKRPCTRVWMPMYVANYPTTLRLELVRMAQDK